MPDDPVTPWFNSHPETPPMTPEELDRVREMFHGGPPPAPPAALWGVVEKMGHKVLAGRITEEERFGGKLGRVDVPQADGGFVTHYFTPQSIYGLTYTTEAAARVRAATCSDVAPVQSWDLPQKVRDAMAAADRQVKALGVAGDPLPDHPPYHGQAPQFGQDDEDEDDASDIRF